VKAARPDHTITSMKDSSPTPITVMLTEITKAGAPHWWAEASNNGDEENG